MADVEQKRPRGRPREFDEAQALDGAIALFCSAGFSAASLVDLQAATGLTGGSLYKAYGDKEGMFAHALARYVARQDAKVALALAGAPDGRTRIARLLDLYAELSQGETGRRGCMVVAGVTERETLGDTAVTLRDMLVRRRSLLQGLVAEGQRDGSIRTAEAPADVADLLLSLLAGMRVLGKSELFPERKDAFLRLAAKALD